MQMRENIDQNNSKYGHFSRSANLCYKLRTNLCGSLALLFSVFMNIVSLLIYRQLSRFLLYAQQKNHCILQYNQFHASNSSQHLYEIKTTSLASVVITSLLSRISTPDIVMT